MLSKGKAAGVLRLVFHDAGTFDVNDNSGLLLMLSCDSKLLLILSVLPVF